MPNDELLLYTLVILKDSVGAQETEEFIDGILSLNFVRGPLSSCTA